MAPLAILGPTRPGRYPRWGYLDRFETNPVMPRACGATLAFFALLAVATFLTLHLRPAKELLLSPSKGPRIERTQIAPTPWPRPPSLQQLPQAPVIRPEWGSVRVVDDAVAEAESIGPRLDAAPGAGDGAREGGWEGDGLEPGYGDEPAPLPARDETFVAVEHEPELVWMRKPVYPEIARDAGIEGLVLVRVLVAADGTVLQVALLQSVLGLDEAALEAAKTAIFRPALQQGLPVQAWVVIPIEFSLRSE